MKAIGYIRLSFKDQSKYSLEVQEAAIKAYCFRHHLKLETLFKDNGQSSATFDRIDFKALESFMKKHKGTIHYLIVMAHDRFSRDLPEALLKIRTLENQFGLKVLSVDEPLDLDTKDPNVLASRTFKYLNASTELMNIRARTKNAILGAQLAGRFINKAPYGYKNDRDFTDKGLLTIITDQATIVHQIFHYYLLDVPVAQIKLEAMKIGFCHKGHNAIYRILGNCAYAGLIRVAHDNGTYTYVKALHDCDQRERMQQFTKKLSNLHQIYLNATCLQKHVLFKHIFKHGFTYVNGQLKAVSISSILLDDNETETFQLKNSTTVEFAGPIVRDERLQHKAEEHFFEVLGELIAELELNNLERNFKT